MASSRPWRRSRPRSVTVNSRPANYRFDNDDEDDLGPRFIKVVHVHDSQPPDSATKKVTRWSYYHEGDVEIPEICVYSIDNRCSFEKQGCSRLHAKCASQWQVLHGSNWYNLRNFHSKEIEDAFEDVARNDVKLSTINPAKLGTAGGGMFKILGNFQWVADFDTMTLRRKDSPNTALKIRRLATKSAAVSKSAKATTYEWYFLDISNNWVKYGEQDSSGDRTVSSITSEDIEKQYITDISTPLNFNTSQFQYSLNMSTMEQINLKTNNTRPIRRRPVKKFSLKPVKQRSKTPVRDPKNKDLPSIWNDMKYTDTMILVPLDSSSQEYKDVMKQLLLTLPSSRAASIKRIQNPFLWRPFKNKQTEMSLKYGEGKLNIQKLFHGTKEKYVLNICKENFDWRLHGTNVGQVYGQGTYFSNSAAISRGYCAPNTSGHFFMFLAEVIVGEITTGNRSMTRPPMNPSTGELFDTTVDNISAPKKFVKYDKQEYCPVYIIEFT